MVAFSLPYLISGWREPRKKKKKKGEKREGKEINKKKLLRTLKDAGVEQGGLLTHKTNIAADKGGLKIFQLLSTKSDDALQEKNQKKSKKNKQTKNKRTMKEFLTESGS